MIDFVNDSIESIAENLLGCIIETHIDGVVRSGIIVDTEMYLGDIDAASHAYQGIRSPRMKAMLLEGGHLYLYEMRGHILMNFVCGHLNETIGVMIRAIQPLDGLEAMIAARHQEGPNVSNGPAKLTQALGITMAFYGTRIGDCLKLYQKTIYHPQRIVAAPRIGIPNKGEWTKAPLRRYVYGNPYCSNIKKTTLDDHDGWLPLDT